jgi:uncharacterized phage protein (TIGR02220 family)
MTQDGLMENRVIILTIETLERLQGFKGHDGTLDLYLFYYKMAKKQKTNQVYCTNSYVADGLFWSVDKVIKVKKTLIDMGLIEMIKEFDPATKKIKGHYVKVNYIFSSHNSKSQSMEKPEYGKHHSMDNTDTNALSNVDINALSNVDINAYADKRFNSEAAEYNEQLSDGSPKQESKQSKHPNIYKDVIDYLNKKTGKRYRHTTGATQRHIRARQKEGFVLQDFYAVIDVKCSQWLNDKNMSKYLRPETLFGEKFESYLNECCGKEIGENTVDVADSDYDENGVRIRSR